jgi:hypothetical protein
MEVDNMARKTSMMSPENLKKVGVILFLGGFLFAQPLLAGIGAVSWGGLTVYELLTRK